jgi:DUF4097 and DUF4098 domain-containing protein YvlB
MTSTPPVVRSRRHWLGFATCALLIPWSVVQAGKAIHEHLSFDPEGSVEIVNVAGTIDLSGWDRPEIDVSGTAGSNVDRVEVTTSGAHSMIHVIARAGSNPGGGIDARLTIHVPSKSSITATLVSADLKLQNLQSDVRVQTVSGDVSGEVGADLHASTVSGSVRVKAPAANEIEVKTISGNIQISGGGGEVEVTTISGEGKLEFGSLKRGRFKSVSGDMTLGFALASSGQIEGESVSGNLRLNFADVPSASFDVQTLSGDISSCFGPKAQKSPYGPGSRLVFDNGHAGHVRIETKSGDVHLCGKDSPTDHSAAMTSLQECDPRSTNRYAVRFLALQERVRYLPLL